MMEAELKEIRTKTSRVRLGGDGILRVEHFPRIEITLDNAVEEVNAAQKLAGGKKIPILVDNRELISDSREAREYYAGEDADKNALAVAILIGSPVGRVMGNFYLKVSRPSFPVRLFTSEDEALKWLRGFSE